MAAVAVAAVPGRAPTERTTAPCGSAIVGIVVIALVAFGVVAFNKLRTHRHRRAGGAGRHRRPADPACRPHPQPGQHGQGLRRPREGCLRGGHRRPRRCRGRHQGRVGRGQGEGRGTPRPGDRQRAGRGRGLPGAEGVGELHAAAGAARRHREPARLRAAVLQRRGRDPEQAGRDRAVDVLRRDGRRRAAGTSTRPLPTRRRRPPSRSELRQAVRRRPPGRSAARGGRRRT